MVAEVKRCWGATNSLAAVKLHFLLLIEEDEAASE